MERNPIPFFERRESLGAIDAIAQGSSLTIYCGAGVTIDRTGRSWAGLVTELLPVRVGADTLPLAQADGEAALRSIRPEELASAIMRNRIQRLGARAGTWRNDRLRRALYRSDTALGSWQHGSLARDVVTLAFYSAFVGRAVRIVTSNYDTYLEAEFESLKTLWHSTPPDDIGSPGLRVWTGGSNPHRTIQPSGEGGWVDVIYLHGRVPNAGRAGGRIVLSENDYAETRGEVTSTIRSALDAAAVLILGASLHDAPLVAALSSTRDRTNRYVLTPRHADELSTHELEQVLRERNRDLGVDTLFPDFHMQVPQFCREVIRTMNLDTPRTYGECLYDWWEAWNASHQSADHHGATTLALQETLNTLRDILNATEDEGMRLELWVRERPSKSNRRLVRWATSDAIAVESALPKFAEISQDAADSAVRAFVEGRPLHLGLDDLRPDRGNLRPESRRRWNSFLAVPVTAHHDSTLLPVGALTLASTRTRMTSSFEALDHDTRRVAVVQLQDAGFDLVSESLAVAS